jgi:hypothetical protein
MAGRRRQKLIDASGREYGVSSAADLWMTVDNATGVINPGTRSR